MNNVILAVFFLFFIDSYAQNNTLTEIFNGVITVNSISKFRGKTRKVVKLEIPKGVKGFYYTIEVNKTSTIRPAARKILLTVLTDKLNSREKIVEDTETLILKEQEKYEDINIYLLNTKKDSELFQTRMNDDFEYLKKWDDVGDEVRYIPMDGTKDQTVYMGFYNTNVSVGLDVYLQVVLK